MELTGKQRRYLRSLGTQLEPVVMIGKEGLHEQLISGASNVLAARELIKVRVLKSCETAVKEVVAELATNLSAELVQIIGRNGLLYKQSDEKPQIMLPY